VGTGYDFNLVKQHAQTAWQQVALRAEYKLSNYFRANATSVYDTIRHSYSSTRLDITWVPGETYVSFGAKYDGIRNKWAAANIYVDGFKWGRLRTSVLLNYNGYTKRFDAQHYSFIYDLHCAEAVLQVIDSGAGFNSGRQIYFFLRLKALPFDTPFGTGQRGQPIGTGTGRDF
jgi:LPS-assembly protein